MYFNRVEVKVDGQKWGKSTAAKVDGPSKVVGPAEIEIQHYVLGFNLPFK